MIPFTQGKALDDYTQQILALLATRGIPYEAVRIYQPRGPGTDAYWDYNVLWPARDGHTTGILAGPYAMRFADNPAYSPANIVEKFMGEAMIDAQAQATRDSWNSSYTYTVQSGPFGLYGSLRPNNLVLGQGGYEAPPPTFGTAPLIAPPAAAPATPATAPVAPVQDLSGASVQSAAGISAMPGTGSAPPISVESILAGMDKASLIQLLMKLISQK